MLTCYSYSYYSSMSLLNIPKCSYWLVIWYNEVIKSISSLFISFEEKISLAQKHVTLKSLCALEKLLPLLFSVSLFLFCYFIFACDVFLCTRNLVLKKINRLEIVLVTSLYYATSVYPYQRTYREFICTHLFLFAIICENLFFLWESFLIICDNLSF